MTLRTRDNILSAQDYNPFGEEIRSYLAGGVNDKYKFTGKERDKESGLDYFSGIGWLKPGARYYDSEVGRWLSVDPLASKYPGWSPYNYCMNNPLGLVDPDGMETTSFVDKDGNEKIINDGSNARFVETGKGTAKHFEFAGFDPTLEGSANINLTTVVQEAQNLNASNPALVPNNGITYCNFATQNIMKAVESTHLFSGVLITGMANDMQSKFGKSQAYSEVDYSTAKANAENGGLSIHSYYNKNGHGHVGTFSVGENIVKGEIANIGAHNGFMNLHGPRGKGVYSSKAQIQYYILRR